MTDTSDAAGPMVAARPLVVLLGAVGAGKGTQASIVARQRGLLHLSTGDLFRHNLGQGTALGQTARTFMDRGQLVPDEITIAMVAEELARPEAQRGVVFDGFPRTVAQAEALDRILAAEDARISDVVLVDVPEEALVARVSGRWVCPTCATPYHATVDPPRRAGHCDRDGSALVQREDDRPEVFRARLRAQIPPLHEVVRYYQASDRLARVDGDQPIEGVTAAISAQLAR